jgi:hypothetical protein
MTVFQHNGWLSFTIESTCVLYGLLSFAIAELLLMCAYALCTAYT